MDILPSRTIAIHLLLFPLIHSQTSAFICLVLYHTIFALHPPPITLSLFILLFLTLHKIRRPFSFTFLLFLFLILSAPLPFNSTPIRVFLPIYFALHYPPNWGL